MTQKASKSHLPPRPPIVAVLGHVDHGKTTLLDTIRKTSVTAKEAGGITQHIGAYQIKIKNQSIRQAQDRKSKIKNEDERSITFIDTPGHEAFSKMRSRGVTAADIAILVVAANDGVMPQTQEAIAHIQKAKIPMIVVANKIDLPGADIEKVKQQLASSKVLVEGYGGDVVLVPVSAKTGKGVPELLDMILLVAELKNIQADPNGALEGVVIEVKFDKKRGVLVTIIIKNGSLSLGQTIYAETVKAKVRSMHDEWAKPVTQATVSMPVEVMGWQALPEVGAGVYSELNELTVTPDPKFLPKPFSLPPLVTAKKLKLILKADVAGSLEAIKENLGENVDMVRAQTGDITESDVLLAKSTGAAIIGFNLKVSGPVQKLAATEKVRIKVYRIIYELLDEIKEVLAILNQPEAQEEVLGQATILAEFVYSDQRVAGCKVSEGRVARGDLVKIMRKEEVGRARVKSIRHGKEDISKAETGSECGIVFDKKLDFKIGDLIIAYRLHELLA